MYNTANFLIIKLKNNLIMKEKNKTFCTVYDFYIYPFRKIL